MALADHLHAAYGQQRECPESESLRPEQGSDDDVAPVRNHRQSPAAPRAETVGGEDLVRFVGQLHGEPACFIETSGEAPVPPSDPEMVITSASAFATPTAMVLPLGSLTSFTETRSAWLERLEVVDELGEREVFDRVECRVWGRGEIRE